MQRKALADMDKQPTMSANKEARKDAEKYLWHLRPPWHDKFDHEHWWMQNPEKANQDAAVWEVLRRHPQTGKLLTKETPLYQESSEIEFTLAFHGALSWPKIGKAEWLGLLQKRWSQNLSDLPPQWGVSRHGLSEIDVIQNQEIKDLGKRYWDTYKPSLPHRPGDFNALKRAQKIWNKSAAPLGAFGGGSNFWTFCSLSLGRVLIGFDPNKPGIEKLVQKKVREIIKEKRRRKGTDAPTGRSFWKVWLDVIAKFEEAELARTTKQKRDDQLFARYRRIISARPWPN